MNKIQEYFKTHRIYVHQGTGDNKGVFSVAIAQDIDTAKTMIRKKLDESGINDEELNISESRVETSVTTPNNGNV